MSNSLVNEISPYLLQHKDNPVNWYSWNNKSLLLAKSSKLPILLSIGYSSCHWCHVMAHESFENIEIANYMNSHFINIKVDREERPDIDSLYQTVLSLMGQQGGWPLTMFLDENLKPFWGGTYFPDVSRHGIPGFLDVLKSVSTTFNSNKDQVINNSNIIHLSLKKLFFDYKSDSYDARDIDIACKKINSLFDRSSGGLAGSPKFPMIPLLKSLLLICFKKNDLNTDIFNNINKTIVSICLGGIYDHLSGGFARYSTDKSWLAPHFEKMLYDNGHMIEIISVLYNTNINSLYKNRIEQTFNWLVTEMMFSDSSGDCYYASIDADSNGKEGEYYVWELDEITAVLKNNAVAFANEYGLTKSGNWENKKNILHRIGKSSKDNFSFEFGEPNRLNLLKLLKHRSTRAMPFKDTKILTDWNLILACGLIRAFHALGNEKYLVAANKVFSYIEKNHIKNNEIYHSSRSGVLGQRGTLDDYAHFIRACFLLFETSSKKEYLDMAKKFIELSIENFYDEKISDFYYSNKKNSDLFIKTKSIIDTATQSGSGLMLENLSRAHIFFDNKKYNKIVDLVLKNNWFRVRENPTSHPSYLAAACLNISSYQVCVLVKNDAFEKEIRAFLLRFASFFILNFINETSLIVKKSPLYGKKCVGGKTTVYVCGGFVCSAPITSVEEMKRWIKDNTVLNNI